ncbi:hypothetical protein BDZ45DRAFT_696078 [Acephala macrosclerotiorum]|nr:hypothetical protein BDZ45DRAFT_696078 [Acephala macrosclerotiorum]
MALQAVSGALHGVRCHDTSLVTRGNFVLGARSYASNASKKKEGYKFVPIFPIISSFFYIDSLISFFSENLQYFEILFARCFGILAALASIVNVSAQDFHYRTYEGRPCNQNDPAGSKWPNGNNEPNAGYIGNCYNLPYGINWGSLEMGNNWANANAYVKTSCNQNCGGGISPI